MKYFSIDTVASAYKSNTIRTKSKFWGLLAILSSLDSPIRPGVTYDFSSSEVSNKLESLFRLDDNKLSYQSDSTWNIMFSKVWVEKVSSLLCSGTPNIYDVIVWLFRRRKFDDSVDNATVLKMFLEETNLTSDEAKKIFDCKEKNLQYSNELYKENELLKKLGISGVNVTAEGGSISSNPGRLTQAGFVQTLYSGQGIQECVIITPFRFEDLYGVEVQDESSQVTNSNAIDCSKYIELLREKKNLVLTGAPGTGKTHLAKEIAKQMGAICQFVQFHPSYDYTDFVEGLRPVLPGESNSEVQFERKDGIFKHFCKTALKDLTEDKSGKPFVFIIDEINRGEISKIFGELFFSIDPGYRGVNGRVTTQYQELITDEKDEFKDGFFVPDNVYIIGTMNDIDRSVESMDFAIRRRFAWREITAEQSAINMKLPEEVRARMKKVNDTIEKCELSSAYHIGGAYFRNVVGNDYEALWNDYIKGLIEEYYRGNPDGPNYIKQIHDALVSA